MNVIVNGEVRDIGEGTTVGELARSLTEERRGVAVAVNGEVVRRADWDEVRLRGGDRVELVAAVQGG